MQRLTREDRKGNVRRTYSARKTSGYTDFRELIVALDYKELTFDLLGGQNTLDNPADISQVPRQPQLGLEDPAIPIRMVQALNVWAPNDRFDISTRPGFSEIWATGAAISATNAIITGIAYQGAISDRLLVTGSVAGQRHTLFRDNAGTATEITLATNLTIGQDNLTSLLNFTDGTNPVTIILSLLRDLPQSVNAAASAANFTIAGTGLTSLKPAFGVIFGGRAHYMNCDRDGTVFRDRDYFTDLRDGNLITDHTTQFLSFERTDGDPLKGALVLSDVMLVGSRNHLSFVVKNTSGSDPFRQQDISIGGGQGPVSHQGMIKTSKQRAAWAAPSGIFSLEGQEGEIIKERTPFLRPFWKGLNQDRFQFISAGYDSQTEIGVWAVSQSAQSAHNRVVGVNFATGENYVWSLTRNAFGVRLISGEQILVGGGFTTGKIWKEVQTSVFTGNAEDASAAIDADVITPRHHCGTPTQVKIFLGVIVTFDQQGTSEAVTVQWRLNDASAWNSFAKSPYTVAGTAGDVDEKFFPLTKAGTHIQLRFRDVNTGQAYRIQKYSIRFKEIHSGLVVPKT